MPVIVVGGSARIVGKTTLVCALIAGLPEFRWTAVKITSHRHGVPEPVWEELEAGQRTDTARYLSAGAHRAFLLTAENVELPGLLEKLQARLEEDTSLIFESNRIVDYLKPDLCLAVNDPQNSEPKPSFARFAHLTDATVVRAGQDRAVSGAKQLFELVDLAHLSLEMQLWLRTRLLRD